MPSWLKRPAKGSARAAGLRLGFRSGLEAKISADLEAKGEPVVYETFKLPYIVPEKRHNYTPDWRLRNGILAEGKGIFDATDRAKHLFIKNQMPDLDIRFVFSGNPEKTPCGPGVKMTLAEWCRKWQFKFAWKLIPQEWLDEPGPTMSPEEVIAEGPYGYLKRVKA